MQIHFICLGNVYRSRMAEAIFNSLNVPDWKATSSGVWAYQDSDGPIWSGAKEILAENNLLQFTPAHWTDCSPELLEKADKIIYMHPEVVVAYQARFGEPTKEYEVWDIQDMHSAGRSEEDVMQEARATFEKIKDKIKSLALTLVQ